MATVTLNTIRPRTTNIFGKRAILGSHVLKSYVEAVDPELHVELRSFPADVSAKEVAAAVSGEGADVIAFSTYVWNIERVLAACEVVKRHSGTCIILGGPGSSYQGHEILTEHSGVDAVVRGEGETAFVALVQAFVGGGLSSLQDIPNLCYRDRYRIVETRPGFVEPLDQHIHPLDVTGWDDCARICYESSRGCVMKCKFCLWHKDGGSDIRCYPLQKVAADLRRILSLKTVQMVEFVDADLFMRPSRALEILKTFRALNDERERTGLPRVFLLCESNPEMLNDELIDELGRHDRVLDFGLQTIDKELQRRLGRPFNQLRYFGNLRKIVTAPSDRFAEHMVEVIYGLPGDTLDGFRATIQYVLNLDYLVYIWGFRYLLMPGTISRVEAPATRTVYNLFAPYEITSSESWPTEDLKAAEQMSRALFIVQYAVPDVFDTLRRLPADCRMDAIDALTGLLSAHDADIDWLRAQHAEEVFLFQQCCSVRDDPQYESLRICLSQACLELLAWANPDLMAQESSPVVLGQTNNDRY